MSDVARAETGVILAAHGELGDGGDNGALRDHAGRLAAAVPTLFAGYGLLKGEPALERALATAAAAGVKRLLVYPFLMSDGYFASKVLPARIRAWTSAARGEDNDQPAAPFDIEFLQPLGLDPRLPGLVRVIATAATQERGRAAADCHLLLVGHGSKLGPASANATSAVASQIAAEGAFEGVSTAFLEEPPHLEDALRVKGPLIVVGLFTGEGVHGWRDVPQAIARVAADAIYTGPIGTRPEIVDLIVAAVQQRL